MNTTAGTEEVVTMICPNLSCQRTVCAPETARGHVVRCAHCQTPFRVPQGKGEAGKGASAGGKPTKR
jgi:hypothetical protein